MLLAGLCPVKALAGGDLVRDNGGSGEAYGGWLESADFDNHFFVTCGSCRRCSTPLLPTGAPPNLAEGEFATMTHCATCRRFSRPAVLPWWLQDDPQANPRTPAKYRPSGTLTNCTTRPVDAQPTSDQPPGKEGLPSRPREVIEPPTARACYPGHGDRARRRDLSGYVVTGEADTPISTAGMWDDLDRRKFEAGAFRAFNDDLVLLAGWDRRRTWDAGGDRPALWDPYSYPAGTTVRAHLIASNYTAFHGPARLTWQAAFSGKAPLAEGEAAVELVPGRAQELIVAQFLAPKVAHPRRVTLQASIETGGYSATNTWPLWIYPPTPWAGMAPFLLLDPLGVLTDLPRLMPDLCQVCDPGREIPPQDAVLVCTAWNAQAGALVAGGGRAILLQQRDGPPGPLPVVACPYWREALKLAEPHPAWGDFPHNDPGLQFYALAADCALDAAALMHSSRQAGSAAPLLRRLDTRGLDLHDMPSSWSRVRAG